jgi:hypothetical protein
MVRIGMNQDGLEQGEEVDVILFSEFQCLESGDVNETRDSKIPQTMARKRLSQENSA